MLHTGAISFTARKCDYTAGQELECGSGVFDTEELGDVVVPPHLLKYNTRRRHREGYVVHGIDVSATFSSGFLFLFFFFSKSMLSITRPHVRGCGSQNDSSTKTMVDHHSCHTIYGVV
jgi:hypothetical protein